MKRFVSTTWLLIFLSIMSVVPADAASAQNVTKKTLLAQGPIHQISKHFSTQTTTYSDGVTLRRNMINGPPKPPYGYELERSIITLPKSYQTMRLKTLTVPAFNWVFGCSSVSGAMIAGYYDRNGYPNIYNGPTNDGFMPLDNRSWPTWTDGFDTYPNLPLAASHEGVDGRTTRGSIDDYWVQYGSEASDPYVAGSWTQHTWGDAIGDYMKTSQEAWDNNDGWTSFYTYNSIADPLTCSEMEDYSIHNNDGTYGIKLFYEARGYTVTTCYSQKTDNIITGGFSFAQYKAQINAGRPVMLQLEGHTIVGVGYNETNNTVYIHDTWDYSTHAMTWGGSYSGMALQSVSIVNLQGPTPMVKNDFNNDGRIDILWRNTSNGKNLVWYMSGVALTAYVSLPTVTDQAWKIAGTGDFNNDGKPDILWRNTSNGSNLVWFMNGVALTSYVFLPTMTDQAWKIAGTGDFNNDGKPDILWRNTSNGSNLVWYMNGIARTAEVSLPAITNQAWTIAGTGDFNSDGKPDILWRNTSTGGNMVWYMNGVTRTSKASLTTITDPAWTIAGTGDFNNDGKTDILWRHTSSGKNLVWYMNGIALTSYVSLPTITDQTWKVVGK